MTTIDPCRIWSVCRCFWGLHGVDLYPGRLGMPSREMVPFRGLVLGPEPQAMVVVEGGGGGAVRASSQVREARLQGLGGSAAGRFELRRGDGVWE